jgi:hypothetical protein
VRAVRGTTRYWLPFVGAVVCLIGGQFAPPEVSWVLIVAVFGLVLDGATKLFERAGSTGSLWDHRQ